MKEPLCFSKIIALRCLEQSQHLHLFQHWQWKIKDGTLFLLACPSLSFSQLPVTHHPCCCPLQLVARVPLCALIGKLDGSRFSQ